MCLGAGLAISACTTTNELTPRSSTSVATNQALIFAPPGGPAMLNVIETVYANAIKQDIALATEARTPGENKISVTLFQGKTRSGTVGTLDDVPFTQVNLTEEALAAWPGSGMAVSPFYVQNDYGPFGYAIGKPATGDTCLYAWQRIEPKLKPSGAIARGAVVIRLQLCDARRSEQSLLNVMYQLRVNEPVFDPQRARPDIGLIANPIRPEGAAGFTPVFKPPPQQAPSRPAAPLQTQPAVVQAISAPLPPGTPIVPPPTGAGVAGANSGGPTVPLPTAAATSGRPAVIVPPPPTSPSE